MSEVNINYKGSTIASMDASGTKTLQTSGKYCEGNVEVVYTKTTGTAGTPTATKGTVSNHSVSVTPSVTNATGYITGGTKTGTAVTVSASELVSGTKSIDANGTGIDVAEYASVDVSVPIPIPDLQTKTATYTPSESQQTATITADAGYDGLDEVDVTVGAVSSTYVGSGITRRSSTDLTASGATVTAPAGYYESQATKSVASGTAGTPTATKGTVSNHAISITPSVTNTAGYISGGTKTGTAVSVSAAELVSGVLSIAASGTGIDVTNYASVDVDVSSIEVEEGTYTPTANATMATINFSKTHSTPPTICTFMYDSKTGSGFSVPSGLRFWCVVNIEQLTGKGWPFSVSTSSITRYAGFRYYLKSGSNPDSGVIHYGASSSSSGSTDYLRYHVNESAMFPRIDESSEVIRNGAIYEWKAYWL